MSAFPPVTGLHPRFRSKIDLWLGGAILLGSAVTAAMAVGLLLQEGMAALAIIPLVAAGLPVWVLLNTWYGVTDTRVSVHCGPFRTAVPISSIRAIRPTRTLLSAPALSLDRLEVLHDGGTLVISPADKAGFIAAVTQRHAHVAVHSAAGSFVTGPERLLKWSLPVAVVVVLSVVGATVISGSNPLRVDVTPEAVTVHGSWGTSIPLADIATVSLVDTLPHLRRTRGYGAWRTMRGQVASRDLGPHGHAYVTRGAPPYVVATMRDGFLVFNSGAPEETRRLFARLQAQLVAARANPGH